MISREKDKSEPLKLIDADNFELFRPQFTIRSDKRESGSKVRKTSTIFRDIRIPTGKETYRRPDQRVAITGRAKCLAGDLDALTVE